MAAARLKIDWCWLLALMVPSALCAQETRRTVTNPSPNPLDDSKPNSSAVPNAYALVGHFDRIVVIRLKNKANLLDGHERRSCRNSTFRMA